MRGRTQIAPFGCGTGARSDVQLAVHIGGSRPGELPCRTPAPRRRELMAARTDRAWDSKDMSGDAAGQDFVLTVLDVFRLAGSGTAVTGRVGSGALRTGETVEILDGGSLVVTARATVEMITTSTAGPRKVSLLLA